MKGPSTTLREEQMRSDITTAISKAPSRVQQELTTTILGCLTLLDENLPKDETVEYLCSGAPTWIDVTSANCLFAITDSRFPIITPAPQVISFYLTDLDKVQFVPNQSITKRIALFIIEGDGASYQFGIVSDYGSKIDTLLNEATAIARIQNQ
jgi:hypothetical protein